MRKPKYLMEEVYLQVILKINKIHSSLLRISWKLYIEIRFSSKAITKEYSIINANARIGYENLDPNLAKDIKMAVLNQKELTQSSISQSPELQSNINGEF